MIRRLLAWFVLLWVLQWAAAWGLSLWARRGLREALPEGSKIGSVCWRWPVGVTVHNLVLPDPAEEVPFLLKLEQGDFDIPVWGVLIRPIPVHMTLKSPTVQIHPGNLYPVIQGIGSPSRRWLPVPMWEREKPEGPAFPFAPLSLRIVNGRLDALSKEIQPDKPVFTAAHVDLSIGLTALGTEPVLNLSGYGHFVSRDDKIIGMQSITASLYPRRRYGKGFLRLRHERLGDFQKIYQYAPRPILIDSGMADTVLMGEILDGKHLKLTARCLVENLDMRGKVGDVSWGEILRAVEDEGRRYEWVVRVEGDMEDPKFNPHDTILREVEFLMKEKAAARGLKIKEQMFFYADTPAGEGPMEANPE